MWIFTLKIMGNYWRVLSIGVTINVFNSYTPDSVLRIHPREHGKPRVLVMCRCVTRYIEAQWENFKYCSLVIMILWILFGQGTVVKIHPCSR